MSVVMATYNGMPYVREQIQSILSQLTDEDELIVTDDGSTDGTIEEIRDFCSKYTNISFLKGPGKGVIANFENGLNTASREILFLSDQDDVWLPHKIETVCKFFVDDPKITCVLHDVTVVDSDLKELHPSFFNLRNSRLGFVNNIIRNSYVGSAMAFKREILHYALPMPKDIPMHDQWIGLINEMYGKCGLCRERLGLYRRHEGTVTSLEHGSLSSMLGKRIRLVKDLIIRRMQN
ncbi:glycosyltransferase family 2 protein [Bifidobacterium sp. ESL0784]|uniref:glycosyltransferase family 2 protein n=1 Tax=Bifidobacterium sp. ESL0784 TaxID=2983231 RepID=UPI0023F7B771|nr:glycosyltransferase family 2 protein [Bifidobacterium sp. ESL0784]